MPTYSYICDACGHHFEKFQAMSDEPLRTCPNCQSDRIRRLIGAGAGLIFKGSGFYLTDYARKTPEAKTRSERSGPDEAKKTADSGEGESTQSDQSDK